MSDIMASMAAYLLTRSELTDLIGRRLNPMCLPAGTTSTPTVMPSVTYQLIDDPVQTTHDGKTIFKARVQLDAWSDSYKSVHEIGDVLFRSLHGFRGSWPPFTIGFVFRGLKQDDSGAVDAGLEHLIQDFQIGYTEAG